jgi:hypothetical protein
MVELEQTALSSESARSGVLREGSASTTLPDDSALLDQVERIARSEELRGCEVLRRLLRFLANKSILGEADELKEYVVAIDGLGKPPSYDPRQHSAVRIQVGRLRKKLADYYRAEGKDDSIIIDVPKGRFKLMCEYRAKSIGIPAINLAPPAPQAWASDPETKVRFWHALRTSRLTAPVLTALVLALGFGAYHYWTKPVKAKTTAPTFAGGWTADMEDLWRPFVSTDRPLIVAIEDPLFVELNGKKGVYFRDKTLNRWSDVAASPTVKALGAALKTQEIEPSRYYTAFGEVDASFLMAKLLGSRVQNLSVVKTSNLSLRELEDNNVLFVGIENLFFNDQIQATPVHVSLQPVREGIRDMQAQPNQPQLYVDHYSTAPAEEGVAYALVTHLPGPMGGNDVESFTSSRAAGYVAAVKAFTDPKFVQTLVGKLKESAGGRMPRYYQVLLEVKFKDEVPTEIGYVLARELR